MTVEVVINVRDIVMNDRLEAYVTRKITKLDRLLKTVEAAQVDLTYAKSARSASDRQVAQITIRGRGLMLRAEERSDDIYASFDASLDKIERQIEKYKGRRWRGRGDGQGLADLAISEQDVEEEAPEEIMIMRRKRFQLRPMDEHEAMLQMELLSHEEFFVFLNEETHEVNILYRRRDGTLGIIETEGL
ncbi:MAG: ribosome-associated translation inhibitor RaiA [Anaerolineales bacterium]|nr:ribosome-associated translation inhibitor RaiA [Anaerolineales bacterium]